MAKPKLKVDDTFTIDKTEFVVIAVSSKYDGDTPFDFQYEIITKEDFDKRQAAVEEPAEEPKKGKKLFGRS